MKVCIFIAKGFEELESISVVDILRRGNVDVHMVSITDSLEVFGAHDIKIICDKLFLILILQIMRWQYFQAESVELRK